MSFFRELILRTVIRVGMVYDVVAWLDWITLMDDGRDNDIPQHCCPIGDGYFFCE